MEKKQKGDIAEQAVILKCLQLGWAVLTPIGDRLPYDLVIDTGEKLVKIQVKSAWLDKKSNNYMVDNRKTNTNTRNRKVNVYNDNDFHYAIIYIEDINIFYIMPSVIFNSYGSCICFIEEKRQRKAKSYEYRNSWNLII